jgi:dTDP-4-amino-4,6-dideoxygalactose transaminase
VKQRLNLLELEQKLPYIHNMVGWNYRMTEMQSAIGLAELGAWIRGTCRPPA